MKTEVKVGFFVFFSFLILIFSIAYLGRSSFSSEGKEYMTSFKFLNDLKQGAEIKFAGGIVIGYVKEIKMVDQKIQIKLWIQKDFKIFSNMKLTVLGEGFLGEKYVNVEEEEDFPEEIIELSEGAILPGEKPVSFDEVLKETKRIGQKLSETLDNINFILGGVTRRKDVERITLGAIKLLKETEDIIAGNKENINTIIKEVVLSIKQANAMLSQEMPTLMRNANSSLLRVAQEATGLMQEVKGVLMLVKSGQ
ncbi:MAG: hypothetical protein CVV50_03050, partial [Spirochaetae bacterium HGW-Spirochaetae-6]